MKKQKLYVFSTYRNAGQSLVLLVIFLLYNAIFFAQSEKCGIPDSLHIREELLLRGDHWGYGYDDLLEDLDKWRESPYIIINSIGKSVQNRDLWELRISSDTTNAQKHTIYIHVRTHPNEVQSFWVANEIIRILISEDEFASKLRANCVFYILPMYNPDGVEMEYARENANKIDIESNWYADIVQAEVKVLRRRFVKLMGSPNPVELALNLHSAYKCKRYFVFHDAGGTSYNYTLIEKRFINFVVSYFVSGIQSWNFNVTWKNGTPRKYPESWWWLNFNDKVLALTYEDGNCEEAGDFDKTAFAILSGISDYFGITTSDYLTGSDKDNLSIRVSPNPAKSGDMIKIEFELNKRQKIKLDLLDLTGNTISNVYEGEKISGRNLIGFDFTKFQPSMYLLRLSDKSNIYYKRLIITK